MTNEMLRDAPIPQRLTAPDGTSIAYHAVPGASPGIVFLGGFRSDMTGTKAMALETHCRAAGCGFLRFDYFGHGQSGGTLAQGTLSRWKDDVLLALDRLMPGPVVLVGSSLGGWLMTLVALARPAQVRGLVGVAAAPDFTEDLILPGLSAVQKRELETAGVIQIPSAYDPVPTPITRQLIEDGRRNLVLRAPIPFHGPVRLLHGLADHEVPWSRSQGLVDRLESTDIALTLVKGGDHRLSSPADLRRLFQAVDEVCAAIAASPSR